MEALFQETAANPPEESGSGEVLRGASKGLWKVGVAGGGQGARSRLPCRRNQWCGAVCSLIEQKRNRRRLMTSLLGVGRLPGSLETLRGKLGNVLISV